MYRVIHDLDRVFQYSCNNTSKNMKASVNYHLATYVIDEEILVGESNSFTDPRWRLCSCRGYWLRVAARLCC